MTRCTGHILLAGGFLLLSACDYGTEKGRGLPQDSPPPVHEAVDRAAGPGFLVHVLPSDGQTVLSNDTQRELEKLLRSLLSASTDRSMRRVLPGDWNLESASVRRLVLEYSETVELETGVSSKMKITHVLMPLSGARGVSAEILARNGDTLYSPFLVCDDGLLETIRALAGQSSGQ